MKSRVLRPAAHLRSARLASPSTSTPRLTLSARAASSLSQKPNANHVSFPGAVKSAFTHTLKYETPSDYPALSTYRVVDQDGIVVDESFKPDLSDDEVIKLYKDMVYISIMDLIMFDAQRQGRLSFYMVSAGEEALSVGSASVLAPEDVVFCQYREQGVFKQRGFTTSDFMSQLFANAKDPGRGRNMPVHYGSKELNIDLEAAPTTPITPAAQSGWRPGASGTRAKEKTCRDETRSEVLKGFREAEAMKKPPMRSMFEDVYEELTPDLKNQMAQLKAHLEKYPDEYDCSEFEGGADSLKP
ncbi:2-oxoisovalerate dehydrogenase subunit alpha [Verticillium dahliae VdLs.17]|uniref:2-oxoisovalerate dehydrogenase subunit alpha n=1 Tax=Verticillium dahliae (strain VdLs.17 / ATCC MYA-4575 / FGSC 10137) TaxID=498257 RepID=G2X5H6_VERDV|nr:2-oxoisovalerate dehydrogenase subunit alpha [Verticillium dahliae VdLs.17]EGY14317.1 2-oxoisovalerate dehydrogenase subunit alpha [Verticillium dahliae VdLs.17]